MPTQLYRCLAAIRAALSNPATHDMQARLAALPPHPLAEEVGQQIAASAPDSSRLFALSTAPEARTATGFLKTREYPKAGFECFDFAPLETPQKFRLGIPPNAAKPVDILAHTAGMAHTRFVALFPEHFTGKAPQPGDKAFYFINKFIWRTRNVTLPLTRMFWETEAFQALLSAPDPALSRAMTGWVTMHEGLHQTGAMPSPDGLAYKSTRSAAAFEELRVDLLVLRHAAKRMDADAEFRLLFELVLAERLMRYGAEYDPQTTFDPRTSLGLYAGLQKAGALTTDPGTGRQRLDLAATVRWIAEECARMEALETRIKGYAPRDIRVLLRVHIEQLAGQEAPWTRPAYFEEAHRFLQEQDAFELA